MNSISNFIFLLYTLSCPLINQDTFLKGSSSSITYCAVFDMTPISDSSSRWQIKSSLVPPLPSKVHLWRLKESIRRPLFSSFGGHDQTPQAPSLDPFLKSKFAKQNLLKSLRVEIRLELWSPLQRYRRHYNRQCRRQTPNVVAPPGGRIQVVEGVQR